MSAQPLVVVYGKNSPLFAGLLGYLKEKEHSVLGLESFEEYEKLVQTPEYVFVLSTDVWRWKEYCESGGKLCVISVDTFESMPEISGDWRMVVGHQIYGSFLNEKDSYLFRLFLECVSNKTLHVAEKTRMLWVGDFFDAVLRCMFFSGTKGEIYHVVGIEETADIVSKILWEEGRMTVKKIEKINSNEVESGVLDKVESMQKKIRWRPKTEFKQVAALALAPYFERLDSLIRTQKTKSERVLVEVEKKQESIKNIIEEVVLEEPVLIEEKKIEEVKKIEVAEEKIDTGWKELIEPAKVLEVVKPEEKVVVHSKSSKGWGKLFLLVTSIVFFLFGIVGVWVYSGLKAIEYDMRQFSTRVINNEWETILSRNSKNIAFLNSTEKFVYLLPGTSREGVLELFRLVEEEMYLQGELKGLFEMSKEISAGVWGDKKIDWKELMPKWQDSLVSADTGLARLEARLSGNLLWVPKPWFEQIKKFKSEVTIWRGLVHQGVEAMPVLSEIIGADGRKRTFLVLLQNESELRPTGGFIGSYGILTFDAGKFVNFRVSDVYVADGQIKGYIEPPTPIVEVLGEASWHMRDANWQPYFVASSKDIRWFYEKATGEKVDGVIGLTLSSVEKILGVIGEIRVPDFGITVTKDNLYEQAQFYAEKNFFPGSTQKQSFLGAVSSQLFEEIRIANTSKQGSLVEALVGTLNDRSTQIALNAQIPAQILSRMGWDGGLYEGKCPVVSCYADYFFPVEANLGVNKANYFIYRDINLVAKLGDGLVNRKVKINYENSATSSSWPAGNYKNYIRFYLPADASIEEVYVTNPAKPEDKLVYDFSKISVKSYAGKKELGLLIEVPISEKRSLNISYSSKVNLDSSSKFSYLLYAQRQSGLGKKTGFEFELEAESPWTVGQVHPEAQIKDNGVWYKNSFLKDILLGVELLP